MKITCTLPKNQLRHRTDWATVDLPDAWTDRSSMPLPFYWLTVLWYFWRKPLHRVTLPEGVPGKEWIPAYVLQTFHNVPNGNYSNRISRGYIAGFDRVMLGEMTKARQKMAGYFKTCTRVLDLGCGGGRMAQTIHQTGAADVWGLDPSPYLLRHAAKEYPDIHFVQGLAEQMPFESGHFDGIAACFLFHEMPARTAEDALRDIFRVLKPGGILAICEPSRVQLTLSWRQLVRQYGWRGLYFKWLAKYVREPFLQDWHTLPIHSLLTQTGFELVNLEESMPVTYLIIKKPSAVLGGDSEGGLNAAL